MLKESQIELIFKEVEILTSRSGGKGGQNVNKVESKVQVVWNFKNSLALSDEQKNKIARANGIVYDVFSVVGQKYRSQLQNKEDACKKLILLINKILKPKKKRIPTKISKATKEKILKSKKVTALKKLNRRKSIDF